MRREDLQKVHSDTVMPIPSYLAFEVDLLLDQLEECIEELSTPKTCESCEYLAYSDDYTCNHECMKTYYGISFDIETFYCSNYMQKGKDNV